MLSEFFLWHGYFGAWFVLFGIYALYMQGLINDTWLRRGKKIQGHMQRLYGAGTVNLVLAIVLVTYTTLQFFLGYSMFLVALGAFVTVFLSFSTLIIMRDAEVEVRKLDKFVPIQVDAERDERVNKQKRLGIWFKVSIWFVVVMYGVLAFDAGSNIITHAVLPKRAPMYLFLCWEWIKVVFMVALQFIPYIIVRKHAKVYESYVAEGSRKRQEKIETAI
ncbi:hypothetical protein B4086_5548 [Bacillus cereus]|nr:hypothetical protein B4086_5548 [Bacillus cereus]